MSIERCKISIEATTCQNLIRERFKVERRARAKLIPQFYGWISGIAGADAANVGLERRAQVWTQASSTVTL